MGAERSLACDDANLFVAVFAVGGFLGITALLRCIVHVRAAIAIVPAGIKTLSPQQKKLTGIHYNGPYQQLKAGAFNKAKVH